MKARTIYLLLVFALGVLACMATTVGVTLSVVQRQNREIQRQELRQQEEGRRATCALVGRILAAYEADEDAPPSETRTNVINAWRDIGRLARCGGI